AQGYEARRHILLSLTPRLLSPARHVSQSPRPDQRPGAAGARAPRVCRGGARRSARTAESQGRAVDRHLLAADRGEARRDHLGRPPLSRALSPALGKFPDLAPWSAGDRNLLRARAARRPQIT